VSNWTDYQDMFTHATSFNQAPPWYT